MHIKKLDVENWVKKIEGMGIREFQFKDLPDDLKRRILVQKARDLGLLESINVINGRHTWKVVPSTVYKKMKTKR